VLPQANAYAMIRRRAAAAGIKTKLGNHSFRATGITAYLKNGGTPKRPPRWRTMLRRTRRSFTIAGVMRSSIRSSGS
jgi:integrase